MKIVKAKEMARIERLSYAQGASEEKFMNEAGRGVAKAVLDFCVRQEKACSKVILLCGSGNNAGDAYVAGTILLQSNIDVQAIAIASLEKSGPLCQLQAKRFQEKGGKIFLCHKEEPIPLLNADVLIDGILGTGFHGQVEGLFFALIEKANASKIPIIAVDIPSGIDGTTGVIGSIAIQARETIFLGLPKTGCFIGEAWNHVGEGFIYNFGLESVYIEQAEEDFIALSDEMVTTMLPPLIRNRHKYQAGYVVGLGGSFGMPGAPIMASYASLRSGAGIVRLLHPKEMAAELAAAPFEIVKVPYLYQDTNFILEKMQSASACFLGPGFGTSQEAENVLKKVLPELKVPYIVDAEALTLLSQMDLELPSQGVLTPHHGEMKRLLHHKEKTIDFLSFFAECQNYCEKKNVTLVLKGAPTLIFHPATTPFLCARGNPGMATAGSGDILTGIIAALLSAGKAPLDAACAGVYLHALAGDFAMQNLSPYCMVATDLLSYLPRAFFKLLHTK